MKVLVVNDDGIGAEGIHKLAEALSPLHDVYVCAPHTQQSASGHGITIGRVVYIEEASPFAGVRCAISMNGTPADCVKIGLEIYRARGVEIDMVFSGFNHGMNLGTDTLYSGTVSAAIEGALCGLPAVAMSISSNQSFQKTPVYFETAMKLASRLAPAEGLRGAFAPASGRQTLDFIRQTHSILNVNIPDLPPEEIKGIKVCPLSYRAYDEWFREQTDASGRVGYHYSGTPQIIGEAGAGESDIIANGLGYATITPLRFDLTDYGQIDFLREQFETADDV